MTQRIAPESLAPFRERLQGTRGKDYWRSLEELANSPDFQELVEREFSGPSGGWTDPVSRRRFLVLMAASLGLAGLGGCTPAPAPRERIVPYVRAPEQIVPGLPLFFATAMPFAGDALGLLVQSHEGRPTKVEGNPEHPGSPKPPGSPDRARFGSTNVFAQASILSLYDPGRSQTVTHLGNISTWDQFSQALRETLGDDLARIRLRVLTETVTSPSLAHRLNNLTQRFPRAKWVEYEPIGRENVKAGAERAFGEYVEPQYRIDQADVILALDADFLSEGPGYVRHMHDFASRRKVHGQDRRMNRLYAVESTPSGTGAIADHRFPLRSADVEAFARGLAARLDARYQGLAENETIPVKAALLDAIARDLGANRGRCLVIAGPGQPPFVHTLTHALNAFLGNVGRTVSYTRSASAAATGGSLGELVAEMDAGQVDVLVVLGGNPAYTAPADLHFADSLNMVRFRVHLGPYEDETSALCQWHLPEAHFLESWGDARAHDGTVSIVQPLIAPLYSGRTASEVVALLADAGERTGYATVRSYWQSLFDSANSIHQAVRADWESQGLLGAFAGDFETWWRKALHDGLVAGTAFRAKTVALRGGWMDGAPDARASAGNDLEIVFRPDPTIYDGRFANNGWLQELPKPLSKITWDNAVYLSPATAVRLGFASADRPELANEKVVELTYQGNTIEGPLWVVPGHADNAVTVHLGYGRRPKGRLGTNDTGHDAYQVGTNLGFNAYRLRTSGNPSFGSELRLTLTNRRHPLACTQHHHLMENRDLVRAGTIQDPPPRQHTNRITLYNEADHPQSGNQWGMVIDLNVCTGCSACVVACQAENNIPVVGKGEVQRGRDMHWIRVDRYYRGDPASPEIYSQPVPCMHCENAPCELVCPVAATAHSSDGLNDMVYNRCVGTRYCSNNCPYKVRRFNFLQYADFHTDALHAMRNPNVTVRSRGVMEKCTYCVQRIRMADIAADREDRKLLDGDIMTACQSACPAGAIIFGNINDKNEQGQPQSKVAQLRAEPLHYALLEELNTRPRTTYLAALKNPNPEIQ